VFTLVVTQLMNLLFVFGLSLNHAGLALAIGLGACLNASLLYYHLRKAGVYQLQPGWLGFLVKLCVALLMMALVLYYAKGDTSAWLQFSILQRLLYISGLVTLGSLTYFASLFALGFRPRDFMRRVEH